MSKILKAKENKKGANHNLGKANCVQGSPGNPCAACDCPMPFVVTSQEGQGFITNPCTDGANCFS